MNPEEVIAKVDALLEAAGLRTYSSLISARKYSGRDITGHRFGRLSVLSIGEVISGKRFWNCACECGNSLVVRGSNLIAGHTVSCGCYNREIAKFKRSTHGKSRDPEYKGTFQSWRNMKDRCLNPAAPNYRHYGAKGVTICPSWLGDSGFGNFAKDMGKRPPGMTLDRIDATGNYEPSNCRWATAKEQSANKRKKY